MSLIVVFPNFATLRHAYEVGRASGIQLQTVEDLCRFRAVVSSLVQCGINSASFGLVKERLIGR